MSAFETIKKIAEEKHGDNAPYIMQHYVIKNLVGSLDYVNEKDLKDHKSKLMKEIETEIDKFMNSFFTPFNAKVGEGATWNMYSDSHAGTIVKVTKCTVTVQQDIATRHKDWKPEFVVGGFAGHCVNNHDQKYSYERNENGEIITFRWSENDRGYYNKSRGLSLTKGRHEHYDYNF